MAAALPIDQRLRIISRLLGRMADEFCELVKITPYDNVDTVYARYAYKHMINPAVATNGAGLRTFADFEKQVQELSSEKFDKRIVDLRKELERAEATIKSHSEDIPAAYQKDPHRVQRMTRELLTLEREKKRTQDEFYIARGRASTRARTRADLETLERASAAHAQALSDFDNMRTTLLLVKDAERAIRDALRIRDAITAELVPLEDTKDKCEELPEFVKALRALIVQIRVEPTVDGQRRKVLALKQGALKAKAAVDAIMQSIEVAA